MRVLFCAGYAPSLTNFRWNLIERVRACGAAILGTAPESDAEVVNRFEEAGYRYYPIAVARAGVSILGDLRYCWSLRRLMKREKPDLVFCYTMKPVIFGGLAAKSIRDARFYAMITGLGYVFMGEEGAKRRVLKNVVCALLRSSLKSCDGLFFQNPDDEAEFRRLGLIHRELPVFQVAGSGVDLDHFKRVPLLEPDAGGAVKFLLVARMLADKGIKEAAQAAMTIEHNRCVTTLVGPLDPNPTALDADTINSWTTTGQVFWVAGAADVRPFLADCHVYVLPSYREGTPRTVLEAMATGRPIITTDAPGCRETVPLTELGKRQREEGESVMEGENGFLVRVKDAEALREAMQRFIDEPDMIVRLGRRSREIAEEKYDVHKVNKVMIKAMGLNEKSN